MAVTAAIAGAAVMVGTTAYSMKASSDQRGDAKKAADEQAKKDQDLQKQAQDQTAAVNESDIQKQARLRQKQSASPSQGSMGTILTSPLGVPNSSAAASSGGKTLLGM